MPVIAEGQQVPALKEFIRNPSPANSKNWSRTPAKLSISFDLFKRVLKKSASSSLSIYSIFSSYFSYRFWNKNLSIVCVVTK